MNVDAIIFDKDGTLLDFDAFWITVSLKALGETLQQLGQKPELMDEILEAYGVHDGVSDIEGILCKGTYRQMGQVAHTVLQRHGCELSCEEVERVISETYKRNADLGEVLPTTPELASVLKTLKAQNIKMAVVTIDKEPITRKCLRKLGVEELFDWIYSDDDQTPLKPDPYCVYDFCRRTGVEKERVLMVGDTMTDMLFAKNAGISVVGVAKSEGNRQILAPHADAVVPDVSHLPALLNG